MFGMAIRFKNAHCHEGAWIKKVELRVGTIVPFSPTDEHHQHNREFHQLLYRLMRVVQSWAFVTAGDTRTCTVLSEAHCMCWLSLALTFSPLTLLSSVSPSLSLSLSLSFSPRLSWSPCVPLFPLSLFAAFLSLHTSLSSENTLVVEGFSDFQNYGCPSKKTTVCGQSDLRKSLSGNNQITWIQNHSSFQNKLWYDRWKQQSPSWLPKSLFDHN